MPLLLNSTNFIQSPPGKDMNPASCIADGMAIINWKLEPHLPIPGSCG
jgi:hypothetical protein